MTGLYPEYTGERSAHVQGWRERHGNLVTLNQLFKTAGYTTVGVGEIYHSWEGPDADVLNWSDWFDTYGYQHYVEPESIERGKAQAAAFGVEFQRRPTTEAATMANAADMYHDGYRARVAMRQIGKLASEETPFFMAVGFSKPHLPFSAPKVFWDLYDDAEFAMPANQCVPPGYPEFARSARPGEMRIIPSSFYGEITVGRLAIMVAGASIPTLKWIPGCP